jgi:hypothetical protein
MLKRCKNAAIQGNDDFVGIGSEANWASRFNEVVWRELGRDRFKNHAESIGIYRWMMQ